MGREGQDLVPFSEPQEEVQDLPGRLEGQDCPPPMAQRGEDETFLHGSNRKADT